VSTPLKTTLRSDLRPGCGVNTHFCFNPSVYSRGTTPNPDLIQALIDLKIGVIRERYWPHNVAQQKAFQQLTDAGIGLYLFIGDIGSTTASVQSDAKALAATPYASSVVGVCGPNEPNAGGGKVWPSKVVSLQQALYSEVNEYKSLKGAGIVGPVLKHNVANIDADYQALAAAGVGRWCDVGDFHYYPGNAGPSGNAREAQRAGQAYGKLSLWQSETGWTGADTDPATAARFSVEALLRNHLTGMVGTIIYELADESQYVQGREGVFGLRKPDGPKPAYLAVQKLLATPDGRELFDGSLAPYSQGVESDCEGVVTSEGQGNFTVYLLRGKQMSATLELPPQFKCDTGSLAYGASGTRLYSIPLKETMTTVQVSRTVSTSLNF
jgi:hypothetical protein